ncbi:MAG: ribulose-phosphate 3-epimerase [Ignavibacteriaceae bacterium]|nr:ribulose-phosphate 3-epimerase [Ignavibacteriaceae bacterium]
MAILAPSILSADFSNLGQQIRLAELGGADWIHCDVMDGQFVPNITFGPLIIKAVKKSTHLPLDVHLMIKNPDNYIESFINAGADYLTVHLEAAPHLNRTVNRIKELGCKAGVSINPSTPVSTLTEIAEYTDMILLMSVNPGFGGQSFIPTVLKKVEKLVELREKLNARFFIEIDGGIDTSTILPSLHAGVDVFVTGSSVFGADNITAAAAKLKNMLNSNS